MYAALTINPVAYTYTPSLLAWHFKDSTVYVYLYTCDSNFGHYNNILLLLLVLLLLLLLLRLSRCACALVYECIYESIDRNTMKDDFLSSFYFVTVYYTAMYHVLYTALCTMITREDARKRKTFFCFNFIVVFVFIHILLPPSRSLPRRKR
jgi:hypothetical protein